MSRGLRQYVTMGWVWWMVWVVWAVCVCVCWADVSSPRVPPGVTLTRHRRYLLYPDGDPARVQLILGIGLPVDLEDETVTIGVVIKMLYHIPMNSTEYTTNFYNAATNIRSLRSHRSYDDDPNHHVKKRTFVDDPSKLNKSDIIRHFNNGMGYSEGGQIGLNESKNQDDDVQEEEPKTQERKRRPPVTRWDIYKIFENMIERNGLSGRPCILRTICEAAETPFTYHNGLLGELAHILLTPSTSRDRLSAHTDNEYHAAEQLGADPGSDCADLFPECKESVLGMFSEVGIPALMGLG